jgi:hypothetical protein
MGVFPFSGDIFAGALLLADTSGAMAASAIQDRFQGAWAAAGIACDKIFSKKHGEISFVRFYGAKALGLIVKNDRVQGLQATCHLLSMKETDSVFTAVLGCREEIMFDKLVVHFRLSGDDELTRFDPTVPEIRTSYHRCRL